MTVFISLSVHNLVFCMFLLSTSYLICFVDSLTLNLTVNNIITHFWMKLTYFLSKAHNNCFRLRTTSQHFRLTILNIGIINKKHKIQPDGTLNWLQKNICLHYESWNKEGTANFSPSQLGTCTLGNLKFLLLCTWTCPLMTTKVQWILILCIQINFSE